MRLSAVVIALSVAFASIGCGEPGSPASPSSLQPDSSSGLAGTSGNPDTTPSASSPVTVAIKGRLQGEGDPPVFEPPPSPFFTTHLVATGQASHLGRFTLDFSHRVNLDSLEGIGDAVFTFPDGDTLKTHVTGTAIPAGSPTAFTVVEIHEVTGGTGRFAGASGQFTITRAVDFTTRSPAGR